jgi:hypothetical protein
LREEHRLRFFENRVWRKIFGPKWRKTDGEENCIMMNFMAFILHLMRWAVFVAHMREEEKKCLQGFGWKTEGKRPLGRPRRRWKDNIKMDLKDIGIDGENWIRLAQDRDQLRVFVNTVMNLQFP